MINTDRLLAWHVHIFCIWEPVLTWLGNMLKGCLSRVPLFLGSIVFWAFNHNSNTQCCLTDLSYPSQVFCILSMCNYFFSEMVLIKKLLNQLISSAPIFQKVNLRQWLEALTKTWRYELPEESTGEALLDSCLCRIASCHPQDNWLPLWFQVSGDSETIFREHTQQKILRPL